MANLPGGRITRCIGRIAALASGISLKDWSEIAKNGAQIIALAVAGIWTYEVFVHKDAPSLQRHATSGGTFTWSAAGADACLGNYYVSLKNDGLTDFDVKQVRLRMWEFEDPKVAGSATFVDREAIQRETPNFERTYNDGVFVRHFPPGHERSERYAWLFKKEPRRNVLLIVEFFTDLGGTAPEWMQYYWWNVCDVK